MTQNDESTALQMAAGQPGNSFNKAFCIEAILDQERPADLLRASDQAKQDHQQQQRQQHFYGQFLAHGDQPQPQPQPPQADSGLLASYYQRCYQAGGQQMAAKQQAAASIQAAAAAALANTVAMRQLQSLMAGQQQQLAGSEAGPPRQSHSPPSNPGSPNTMAAANSSLTPPNPMQAFGHFGGQSSATNLDWLAKASLIYNQSVAAAAAAASSMQQSQATHHQANHSSSSGGSSNNNNNHLQAYQPPMQDLRGAGSQPFGLASDLSSQDQQQQKQHLRRQNNSPGFVQPIHHHVVMSPNTIASAAFAGKCLVRIRGCSDSVSVVALVTLSSVRMGRLNFHFES